MYFHISGNKLRSFYKKISEIYYAWSQFLNETVQSAS